MTKYLSRQLCELAGIKGKWVVGFAYDVYPNLETPENFVKLLECYFEVIDGVINYHKREEFIAYIIELIEGNNKLKRALRAQDWRY